MQRIQASGPEGEQVARWVKTSIGMLFWGMLPISVSAACGSNDDLPATTMPVAGAPEAGNESAGGAGAGNMSGGSSSEGGKSSGEAGTASMLAAGAGGEPITGSAGAGDGGAPPLQACVERPLLGPYRLQAHNEVTTCDKATHKCASSPRLVEDETVTFALYAERQDPGAVSGQFYGPGISLGGGMTERWLDYFWVYYPLPGDNIDIWSTNIPANRVSYWNPARAGSWVRLMMPDCYDDMHTGNGDGFIHIDIEVATGRVLDFARKCDVFSNDSFEQYRLRGTGALACDLQVCNDLVNSAPKANIAYKAAVVDLGGKLESGTYYLTDIEYDLKPGCNYPVPTEVRETLEVTASSTTTGTLQLIAERLPAATLTATFDYQASGDILSLRHRCGPESFRMLTGASFSASGQELRLREQIDACEGSVTRIYAKQ